MSVVSISASSFFFYCQRALFAFSAPDPACVIYLYPHPVSYSLFELLTPRSFPTLSSLFIFILFDWHPSLCSVFEKQYRSQASVNINRWLIKSNHLLLNANFETHQNLEYDWSVFAQQLILSYISPPLCSKVTFYSIIAFNLHMPKWRSYMCLYL